LSNLSFLFIRQFWLSITESKVSIWSCRKFHRHQKFPFGLAENFTDTKSLHMVPLKISQTPKVSIWSRWKFHRHQKSPFGLAENFIDSKSFHLDSLKISQASKIFKSSFCKFFRCPVRIRAFTVFILFFGSVVLNEYIKSKNNKYRQGINMYLNGTPLVVYGD